MPEQPVIGTWRHEASQLAAPPVNRSTVHASPSSGQVVGQVLGGSHVSPAPILRSPHVAAQSPSVAVEQPFGQQPSPSMQPVIDAWAQARVQAWPLPDARSRVQAFPSSQVCGQAPGIPAVIARSQVSAASTTPSPQTTVQSLSYVGASVAAEQPAGQHPSPPAHAVISVATQVVLQFARVPCTRYRVQPIDGGHAPAAASAHEPGTPGSHLSNGVSTAPFPQNVGQSGSTTKLTPLIGGQQPSPARKLVIGR